MLQNKTLNKIIALVIAVVLWTYVIVDVNPTTTEKFTVPVRILNEENLTQRGLTIVGEREFTVTITLSGKRADLNSLDRSLILADADVYGRTIGEDVSITVEVEIPDSVENVTNGTPRILVTIEELIAVQKPIKVQFEGSFRTNTEPGNIAVQPETVEVRGARSYVEDISYIAATVDASLLTVSETTINVEAVPMNANGEYVEGVKLSSPTVDVTVQLCYTKEIPMYVEVIGEVGSAYEVTNINIPTAIYIKGTKEALSGIQAITASAIDLSQVTASSSIPLTFSFPAGVELADSSKNISVDVGIKGISTEVMEIPTSGIAISGLAVGQTAYISTDTVLVTVVGKESLMENLDISDVTLRVDAVGLEEGTYSLPVIVESAKAFTKLTTEPKEVSITINEAS